MGRPPRHHSVNILEGLCDLPISPLVHLLLLYYAFILNKSLLAGSEPYLSGVASVSHVYLVIEFAVGPPLPQPLLIVKAQAICSLCPEVINSTYHPWLAFIFCHTLHLEGLPLYSCPGLAPNFTARIITSSQWPCAPSCQLPGKV